MKTKFVFVLLVLSMQDFAQDINKPSALDPISYDVVLDNPEMKNVLIKKDIPYVKNEKGSLSIDIYSPPNLKAEDKRPAIIFMTVFASRPGERKTKTWGIYTSWPKLMAAHGYIGISMESDGSPEAIEQLFGFLAANGNLYNIDSDKLGIYAASANVTQSVAYLMGEKAHAGIKAAVLYYGNPPTGPFRKNLPVLFVVAEGDVGGNGYRDLWNEVSKNKAPWTIKMGSGMPHAFDAYSDNDEARKIVKETISFWQNQLDYVAVPSWPYSKGRDALASMQMDRPKAISLLKSLSEENPEDINTLKFYASALRQSKQLDEAVSVYKKLLILEPKNVEPLIAMASIYYSKDKTAKAEEYVSRAVSSGSMARIYYADLGYNLLVGNKNKEAAMYYEKALTMAPRSFDYYNLSRAYAKMNDKDNAFKALDEAIKLGYGSRQQIENNSDFASLKSDNRFIELLSKMK